MLVVRKAAAILLLLGLAAPGASRAEPGQHKRLAGVKVLRLSVTRADPTRAWDEKRDIPLAALRKEIVSRLRGAGIVVIPPEDHDEAKGMGAPLLRVRASLVDLSSLGLMDSFFYFRSVSLFRGVKLTRPGVMEVEAAVWSREGKSLLTGVFTLKSLDDPDKLLASGLRRPLEEFLADHRRANPPAKPPGGKK